MPRYEVRGERQQEALHHSRLLTTDAAAARALGLDRHDVSRLADTGELLVWVFAAPGVNPVRYERWVDFGPRAAWPTHPTDWAARARLWQGSGRQALLDQAVQGSLLAQPLAVALAR